MCGTNGAGALALRTGTGERSVYPRRIAKLQNPFRVACFRCQKRVTGPCSFRYFRTASELTFLTAVPGPTCFVKARRIAVSVLKAMPMDCLLERYSRVALLSVIAVLPNRDPQWFAALQDRPWRIFAWLSPCDDRD